MTPLEATRTLFSGASHSCRCAALTHHCFRPCTLPLPYVLGLDWSSNSIFLPETILCISTFNQPHNIKWIKQRQQEVPLIHRAWALQLRLTVSSKVDLVICRQILRWWVRVH